MEEFKGKTVLIGVTGGIAAYKTCELIRLFRKNGATVRVLMTRAAESFVGKTTFEALSGQPVLTDDDQFSGSIPHIRASENADLFVIAPATANTLAKLARGIADNLLTSAVLASHAPLLVAPAMNVRMLEHPATVENLEILRCRGVTVVGPDCGYLACGETANGRMSEPSAIYARAIRALAPQMMAGERVLVTAGPTVEPIDPVRSITNGSSGRQGYAIAQAAFEQGAEVTLVTGPCALPVPEGVKAVHVTTAQEMYSEVMHRIADTDVFFAVAAVADWRVVNPSESKIKKNGTAPQLQFEENPDILAAVGALEERPIVVGFAAETEDLEVHALDKCLRKGADLIVANNAARAIGSETNEVLLVTPGGTDRIEASDKLNIARRIVGFTASL